MALPLQATLMHPVKFALAKARPSLWGDYVAGNVK
jgi:hypothetical protein